MKAVIFTKTTCPWCVKAKEILAKKNIEIEEHVLGVSPLAQTKEQLQQYLKREVNTVPQIILDDQYIGGCQDLANHFGIQL